MSHTITLIIAYATVCALWWALSFLLPLWRAPDRPKFARPWIEVAWAFLAVIGVLVLGQVYSRGVRFHAPGAWQIAAESLNQILIFFPIVLLPVIRKQGWSSAWIQLRRLWARLLVGFGLALIALLIFSLVEQGSPSWWIAVKSAFRFGNAHLAVQVLLEDIAIAIVFVRVAAATSPQYAILLVALLFAAGHIPAMIANGASAQELLGLVRDFGLGVLVIGTLWRGADIAWFCPVHFALDMTQFMPKG